MEKEPVSSNFYEISQERKFLRKTLTEAEEFGAPEKIIEKLKARFEIVKEEAKKFSIEEAGGLSQAKEMLGKEKEKAESSKWIDEAVIQEEIGEDYKAVSKFQDELSGFSNFEINQLQKTQTDSYAKKFYENIHGEILEEKIVLAEKIKKIETENPIAFRANELVSYNKGLHQEGHIAPTPSVQKAFSEIGSRMISGKPMFLHGPTGAGKTSLARFAANHFTNKDAEMVYCTPQTREASIWGKTGIRPTEGGGIQTVDIYGPLAKAMQEGKTVIFDEFTALPKEQMVFIKGIFNAKIGDSVNVVGNGKTEIAPGFQMIFTANLKSEKNPERQELPPEIAREFEQNNLKIDYTPKDEAYDIMLARLMNKDGSIDASYYDINETLPKFCEAIAEIQIAYTDKESDAIARLTGTKDASGKNLGLKKFVLTQGTVENIIDAWKIEKDTRKSDVSFAEFLDSRLKRALTFEEYSEKDRILAAKILASKGFLRTLSAKDLNLPQEIFAVDAIKKLRGEEAAAEIKSKSADERKISLKELADMDPFGKRQKKAVEQAMRFLPEEEKKENALIPEMDAKELLENNRQFMMDTFTRWYDKSSAENAKQSVEMVSPEELDWDAKKADSDLSKFGEYIVNPDTVGIDWENISPEKIKIFDFAEFVGKPRVELAKHLVENYSDKYRIPGIEYWKYLIENQDKVSKNLKDGNYYYFFGSILRDKDGDWHVPDSHWRSGEWHRGTNRLRSDWSSSDRVLLLEK